MAARVLVLILTSSLLGAAPLCRCEGQAKHRPQKASCGHCPTESAPKSSGCPISDCCCIHEGTDRTSEEAYVLPPEGLTAELDFGPAQIRAHSVADHLVPTLKVGGALRQSGPPLHLLIRHLTI
jgi:hypothetical protein